MKPLSLLLALGASALLAGCVSRTETKVPIGAEISKLEVARKALTGIKKDTAGAKKLLLEIVGKDRAALQPGSLCYAYVYLGYIEDRAGNRKEAVARYQEALATQEGDPGIRECAAFGLKQPLTWIRHLDQATSSAKPPSSARTRETGQGYVTTGEPPRDLTPASTLSPKEQRENFDFLCRAIDETYADFTLKSIDWNTIRQRYQARLGTTVTADDFYLFLFELVNELKDTHSWLENYHPPGLPADPG